MTRITRGAVALLTMALVACSDDPAAPSPAISVTSSANAATVAAGGTANLTITVARTGGFTGAIALTAEGLPAGVTAAFNPASVPSTAASSTLTLTGAAGAAAATKAITIKATGTGVTAKTATVNLTVTAAGGS